MLTLGLCASFALASCGRNDGQTATGQAPAVKAVCATEPPRAQGQEYTFMARPYRTSELSFRVNGPVLQFDTYAGNYYPQGSLIAEIDPRDFQLEYDRTQAVYNRAKAEYDRIEALYAKNNVSASTYEKAKAEYAIARTGFNTARNELNDTQLTAPFNGYIGQTYIERFQDVRAGQPVVSLIDIDRLRIEVYVTQQTALAARHMQTVEVRFDADPGRSYRAEIADISKGTTSNNLSYLLTALLPNPDHRLLAGMAGKVLLPADTDSRPQGTCVPQSTLCHRPSTGDYVWVVDPHTHQARIRRVKTGERLPDGQVCITQGLNTGETVITAGQRFLSDGTTVSTAPETAARPLARRTENGTKQHAKNDEQCFFSINQSRLRRRPCPQAHENPRRKTLADY